MRRFQPQVKAHNRILVPPALREALREVMQTIQAAKLDSDIRLDFDDAIQTVCLVGGRVGKNPRPYVFSYYHEMSSKKKVRWDLAFHKIEMNDIADGHITDLTMYSCRNEQCGYQSNVSGESCDCDYVEDPYWGNIQPENIDEALRRIGLSIVTRNSTRTEIAAMLGEPDELGGGRKEPTMGYIYPWIKYLRDDCQLRFEFAKGEALRMVSIMDRDWRPGM